MIGGQRLLVIFDLFTSPDGIADRPQLVSPVVVIAEHDALGHV